MKRLCGYSIDALRDLLRDGLYARVLPDDRPAVDALIKDIRSGGDEFAVLRRTAFGDGCAQFINGITKMLSAQRLPCKLTVFIGKRRYAPDMKNWKDFMDAADPKMYRVKSRKKLTK